jgi:urease accessory protein
VVRWNAYLRACRETAELRAEDHNMGIALTALADVWDEPRPQASLGYTALFAVLAVNNHIGLRDTLAGYSWAWCENQTLVATKLVPLGHLSGQRMLRQIGDQIEAATEQAMAVADQEIGAGLPGMLLASAQHEQQYSRVFRS